MSAARPSRVPADRDRDTTGRAHNARPRDALGRPLPRGTVGVPRIPEDAVFTPTEALTLGGQLLRSGNAFHAHEVFEAVWKQADPDDRWLWRALAQLAVGVTHVQRGNPAGAAALLRRGAEAMDRAEVPYDVDADGLRRWARTVVASLESGQQVAPAGLRPRLTRDPR